jgi:hypothetical protein
MNSCISDTDRLLMFYLVHVIYRPGGPYWKIFSRGLRSGPGTEVEGRFWDLRKIFFMYVPTLTVNNLFIFLHDA